MLITAGFLVLSCARSHPPGASAAPSTGPITVPECTAEVRTAAMYQICRAAALDANRQHDAPRELVRLHVAERIALHVYGSSSAQAADTYDALASAHARAERHREAAKDYLRAVAGFEASGDHHRAIRALDRACAAAERVGDYGLAISACSAALESVVRRDGYFAEKAQELRRRLAVLAKRVLGARPVAP